MSAFFDLIGCFCLVILLAAAAGFGLTLGIRYAMRFDPWDITIRFQQTKTTANEDEEAA